MRVIALDVGGMRCSHQSVVVHTSEGGQKNLFGFFWVLLRNQGARYSTSIRLQRHMTPELFLHVHLLST